MDGTGRGDILDILDATLTRRLSSLSYPVIIGDVDAGPYRQNRTMADGKDCPSQCRARVSTVPLLTTTSTVRVSSVGLAG